MSKTEVKQFGVINWSATGPTTSKVVIGVDSSSVPTSDADGLLTGPIALKGCKAGGLFGLRVPTGSHVLTVFLIDRSGTSSVIGTQKIMVDAP